MRLRWSEIDSGASLPMTVTTDWPGAKPRSTCSGSHGLHLLVLGDAEADLAHLPERRPVQRAGHRPAGQPHQQPQRPADGQVGPEPGPERAHAAVQADRLPHRPVDHDELPGGLGGHRLAVQVERRVERGPGGRDHDREVRRAAAGQDGARGHPRQRRLAHGGRHQAEGLAAVGPAEHRLDPLGRGRDHRQAVGPAALEHLLELVGAHRAGHRRHQVRVDRRLRGAPRLAQRLGWAASRRAGRRSSAPAVPSSAARAGWSHPVTRAGDAAVRGRPAPSSAPRPARRPATSRYGGSCGDDPAGPAEPAGHPDRHLERILEDGDRGEPGRRPGRAQRAEAAQRHRRGGALLGHEHQQRAPPAVRPAEGDRGGTRPVHGQFRRRAAVRSRWLLHRSGQPRPVRFRFPCVCGRWHNDHKRMWSVGQ